MCAHKSALPDPYGKVLSALNVPNPFGPPKISAELSEDRGKFFNLMFASLSALAVDQEGSDLAVFHYPKEQRRAMELSEKKARKLKAILIEANSSTIKAFMQKAVADHGVQNVGDIVELTLSGIQALLYQRSHTDVIFGDGSPDGGSAGLVPWSIGYAMNTTKGEKAVLDFLKWRFKTCGVTSILAETKVIDSLIQASCGSDLVECARGLLADVVSAMLTNDGQPRSRRVAMSAQKNDDIPIFYLAGVLPDVDSIILSHFKLILDVQKPSSCFRMYWVNRPSYCACVIHVLSPVQAGLPRMKDLSKVDAWNRHRVLWSEFLLKMLQTRLPKSPLMLVSKCLDLKNWMSFSTPGCGPTKESIRASSAEPHAGVIQVVRHSEVAAEISPSEAALFAEVQHAGYVERNFGCGFAARDSENILLLHFNRTSSDMIRALGEGTPLASCRAALREEGHECRLASGAFVFVQPWQFDAAVRAAQEMLGYHGLRSSHVIVAENFEYLVEESLTGVGHGVWAKNRWQLCTSESTAMFSGLGSDSEHLSSGNSSNVSLALTVSNAFLCYAPRSRVSAHSGAHSV
jgi:hypothetical protein